MNLILDCCLMDGCRVLPDVRTWLVQQNKLSFSRCRDGGGREPKHLGYLLLLLPGVAGSWTRNI